jgi:hypothetical protein
VERQWNYSAQQASTVPRTPQERRYLRKRTIVSTAVTFIVLLLACGLAFGDQKPDAGLFAVPVFYALVAAALGWFLPIRRKKKASLAEERRRALGYDGTDDQAGKRG